ncbi:hypothetical protein PR048_030364 [Dryococelus australis]|uniref:Uncharacterized protein n=1 Tax=Dryococelus australis TaxID=614101 RepID=A0ABQ9G8S2_9NEOP|nr:hypothetical protein PR048_030364 [Dryococelus australis]
MQSCGKLECSDVTRRPTVSSTIFPVQLTKVSPTGNRKFFAMDASGIATTHCEKASCRNPLHRPAIGDEYAKRRDDIGQRHGGRVYRPGPTTVNHLLTLVICFQCYNFQGRRRTRIRPGPTTVNHLLTLVICFQCYNFQGRRRTRIRPGPTTVNHLLTLVICFQCYNFQGRRRTRIRPGPTTVNHLLTLVICFQCYNFQGRRRTRIRPGPTTVNHLLTLVICFQCYNFQGRRRTRIRPGPTTVNHLLTLVICFQCYNFQGRRTRIRLPPPFLSKYITILGRNARTCTALNSNSRFGYLRDEYAAAPECKDGGKQEIPEKIRRLAASSGTIRACENPGATPPGNENGH